MRKHNHPLAGLVLGLLACAGLPAHAVTPDQFVVHDTRDMIEICSTAKTDPLYTAAANFCEGYLVGAYHYQEALYSGPGIKQVVCFADPKPSRNEVIAKYVDWAKAHTEYGKDRAVDTFSKFLAETYPCK